jgi:hypothetical protein
MADIGSLKWRYDNYGLYRLLRYFFLDGLLVRTGVLRKKYSIQDELTPIESIANYVRLSKSEVNQIAEFAQNFLLDLESRFDRDMVEVKKGVVGADGPIWRLTLIGCLLKQLNPQAYIETGTQHGISAEFSYVMSKEFSLRTKVFSIDVVPKQSVIANSGYQEILLPEPCGKNLLITLTGLSNEFREIVFAHDSDHTFEHMSWELNHAVSILKPMAVVCDDIGHHRAFFNFSKKLRRKYLVSKTDAKGGCAAIVLGDPDGT